MIIKNENKIEKQFFFSFFQIDQINVWRMLVITFAWWWCEGSLSYLRFVNGIYDGWRIREYFILSTFHSHFIFFYQLNSGSVNANVSGVPFPRGFEKEFQGYIQIGSPFANREAVLMLTAGCYHLTSTYHTNAVADQSSLSCINCMHFRGSPILYSKG